MLFLIDINAELRKVAGSICNAIYSLISILFDVFYNLANIRILNAGYEVNGIWHDAPITVIYKRVTLLLGIIMVFYVTFQFIKYVLEPDTFSDKEKGGEKLVFKLIIVVVLMGTVPTIFDKAYDVQRLILNSHLIDKVLIGNANSNVESFGRNLSANVFSLFYYQDVSVSEGLICEDNLTCQEIVKMNLGGITRAGSMPVITTGLGKKVNDGRYAIHFDAWFAMGVGLFLCYILVLYVIDIGVRVAQLTYLQIIAPIPIIAYLSPKKDGMFQKWAKQCAITFLDLFIRLFIICFMLLVISNISISSIGESINANVDETTKTWVYIALILGLLLFAQKAPKLIQELFPNMGAAMGNFGLKPGDRMPALAAKAAAMGLGGASALARKTIGRTANAIKHNRREKKAAGIDDYKQKKKDYRKAKRDKLNPPEIKAAKDAKEKAKAAYKENYGGNKQKLKAAKKKYKDAKKTGVSAVIEEARKSLHEERDKYQTAKHKKDSITGAFLSGVVTGPVTGIIQGSKAKDLKSISSAVKSASKTASQQVKAHSEWKEQGGEHATGRIIEGVKSHFGIESGIESQKREQDAVQRSIESSEEALKRAQRPAEQSSAMKKALEKPKEAVDAEMAKPGRITKTVGKDITGVTGSAQMEPAKVLSKLEANVTEAEAKLQAAENTKNPRDINKAKRALEEARTNLSKGKKDINNEINKQVFEDIKNSKTSASEKALIDAYGIEIVTAMRDTMSTVTNMSRDSALMKEIKNDTTIPDKLQKAFETTFYDRHGNLLAKPNFGNYEQMKDVKDYLQLYSSNKTRSNEELRLNIEDRKYDLEREKNNASRRYEANAKNPIGSGYTGGSSGK
ncbi:unknown [Clostridium sp. CAG:914]|nr:unknown [Clostridium sp. CAG:914]